MLQSIKVCVKILSLIIFVVGKGHVLKLFLQISFYFRTTTFNKFFGLSLDYAFNLNKFVEAKTTDLICLMSPVFCF